MYTNDGSIEAISGLVGAAVGLVLLIFVIVIALCILMIVSKWKILKKGGKNGWEALIPYYGNWVTCEMVGVCPYWILVILAGSFLSGISIIYIVALIASVYFQIILNVSLAKSFGKDAAFAIGLILLPVVFYPMLGLGSAKFIGANPMKDVIFDAINQNKNNNNNNNNNNNQQPMNNQQPVNNQPTSTPTQAVPQKNAFCTNCGAPLTGDSTFCTNCGTKVN